MPDNPTFRVFISAASGELASYRQEVARVLRRKGIEVRDQEHFRQGGAILLENLNDYIESCDAIICLIGEQCGSLPTDEHASVIDANEHSRSFLESSGQTQISYTQWELILARSHNKLIYPFFTAEGFTPDRLVQQSSEHQALQTAYRSWVKQLGLNRSPLTTHAQLIEDVLVLPFPDLLEGQPNNLPLASLGSLFKGRDQFLIDLHRQLQQDGEEPTAITHKVDPRKANTVHGAGGIGKTRAAIEYA